MGFDNLDHRLGPVGESEQDSPVNKAVAGGEERCSPVDKAFVAEFAVAEGDNVIVLVEGVRRRPPATGFLPESPLPVTMLLGRIFLS